MNFYDEFLKEYKKNHFHKIKLLKCPSRSNKLDPWIFFKDLFILLVDIY